MTIELIFGHWEYYAISFVMEVHLLRQAISRRHAEELKIWI